MGMVYCSKDRWWVRIGLFLHLYAFQRYCRFCAPAHHFSRPTSSLPKISPCSPQSRSMAFGLGRANGVGWIVCAISLQDLQSMWSWSTNITDGQTDDMQSQDRALQYSALRGKKHYHNNKHWPNETFERKVAQANDSKCVRSFIHCSFIAYSCVNESQNVYEIIREHRPMSA